MRELRAGQKLKSAVCDAQVMVIKGVAGLHELSCGGAPMIEPAAEPTGSLDPALAEGSLIGKRYVNADETFEALCVKAGAGSLALDGARLVAKQAKALPSSD